MNVLCCQLGPWKKVVYKVISKLAILILVHVSHSKICDYYIARMYLNRFYEYEFMNKFDKFMINLE